MKYMGSKARHAKQLLPIILENRQRGQWCVEPFVGGANMIQHVQGNTLGADCDGFIYSLLVKMQEKEFSAPLIDEFLFNDIKNNIDCYPEWLVCFAGYQLTFSSQWFGSYRRDNTGVRDYADEAKRNVDKQSKAISHVKFVCSDYRDLTIPPQSIIYCDPPYKDTAQYKSGNFDSGEFWGWAEDMVGQGHGVFVSEYHAPDGWVAIWEKEVNSSLTKNTGAKRAVERLFVHKERLSKLEADVEIDRLTELRGEDASSKEGVL